MSTCRDIEPLVTQYIDGEASAADRAAVASHLEACAPCRREAEQQTAARAVLRTRAGVLAPPPAPASLRARCVLRPGDNEHNGDVHTVANVQAPGRRVLPWAIAVSAVAATVLLVALATRSSTLLAAQLTADHVKCFEFPGSPNPDAHALEAKLAAGFGWRMVVPPGSALVDLSLLTARRCLYADGRIAHVMYRHHQRPVSLFVLPDTTRVPEALRVLGHEAIIWSSDRRSYVLVGRESRAELEQLAKYVKASMAGPGL